MSKVLALADGHGIDLHTLQSLTVLSPTFAASELVTLITRLIGWFIVHNLE